MCNRPQKDVATRFARTTSSTVKRDYHRWAFASEYKGFVNLWNDCTKVAIEAFYLRSEFFEINGIEIEHAEMMRNQSTDSGFPA